MCRYVLESSMPGQNQLGSAVFQEPRCSFYFPNGLATFWERFYSWIWLCLKYKHSPTIWRDSWCRSQWHWASPVPQPLHCRFTESIRKQRQALSRQRQDPFWDVSQSSWLWCFALTWRCSSFVDLISGVSMVSFWIMMQTPGRKLE